MSYGRSRDMVAVTIANGATQSNEANTGAQRIVGVIMPAAWTAANLTLQALVMESSALPKVQTWADIVDQAGTPVVLATAPAAGEYVAIPDTAALVALGRIRVVSSAAQGAARIVQLILTD